MGIYIKYYYSIVLPLPFFSFKLKRQLFYSSRYIYIQFHSRVLNVFQIKFIIKEQKAIKYEFNSFLRICGNCGFARVISIVLFFCGHFSFLEILYEIKKISTQ